MLLRVALDMPELPASRPPIPDLLSAEPAVRVSLAELRQDLVFAFATRGASETFDRALAEATLPASRWDSACFARDLFLSELVERCMPIRIGGRAYGPCATYLLRVLGAPPDDAAVVGFRRGVLAELAGSADLRGEFERIYVGLTQLRTLLCAGRIATQRGRRMEILRAAHQLFADLASSFAGASSGLRRLRDFGEAVRAGEAYRRLDAIIDHEQHLGTVDLRVRVGGDGELKSFQIVAVRENVENPFYKSPFVRLFNRIRFLFRGYRMNGAEVAERLLDDVFTSLEEPVALLFQLLGDMEVYLAGLGLMDVAQARGLEVCFPDLVEHGEAGMDVRRLFNPLLFAGKGKKKVVPCDLRTEHPGSVVIVTGPNSGGKTRLLQAVALAQLLGQAGLFVPAASARLPRFSGLFVSLIEEARADQPEGQLGMELLRIRRMFEELEMGALVLLDELCSGTNPSEGEEIARLVLSLLPELDAQVFITTHLLQLATRLSEDRPIARIEFLQVELDPQERPTYGFVPGVAKSSLAHKTAARLGVTRDELLDLIAKKKRAPVAPPLPPGEAPRAPAEARERVAAE